MDQNIYILVKNICKPFLSVWCSNLPDTTNIYDIDRPPTLKVAGTT